MLRLVPLRHSSNVFPVKRGPLADMFSSMPQLKVQWSMITLCAATVDKESASQPLRFACPSAPVLTRICRMMTS